MVLPPNMMHTVNADKPSHLDPADAAELARDIYSIRDDSGLNDFFDLYEDIIKSPTAAVLESKTGLDYLPKIAKMFSEYSMVSRFGVCAIGVGRYEGHVIIILRGTDFKKRTSTCDWLTNGRVSIENSETGQPVHAGFNRAFNPMIPALKQFLNSIGQRARVIHVIGHSLGGAVATIAADFIQNYVGRSRSVKLYTFGAPRPGRDKFAKAVVDCLTLEDVHRVVHSTDPVTMVPIWPFYHPAGSGYEIEFPGISMNFDAHSMSHYVTSCEQGKQWKNLKQGFTKKMTSKETEEFLKSESPVTSMMQGIWSKLEQALEWLINKIILGAGHLLVGFFQGIGMVGFTIADKLAEFLSAANKLDDAAGELISYWVMLFARKLAQVLGLPAPKEEKDVTEVMLKELLRRMEQRISKAAEDAIKREIKIDKIG